MRRDAFHKKDKFVPAYGTEADSLTEEYFGMETSLGQTLII